MPSAELIRPSRPCRSRAPADTNAGKTSQVTIDDDNVGFTRCQIRGAGVTIGNRIQQTRRKELPNPLKPTFQFPNGADRSHQMSDPTA